MKAANVSLDTDPEKKLEKLWSNPLEENRLEEIKQDQFYKDKNFDEIYSKLKPIERAHLTLATSNGIPPVQSGIDLINIKMRMLVMKENLIRNQFDQYDIYYLGDTFLYLELKKHLLFDALFAAEY